MYIVNTAITLTSRVVVMLVGMVTGIFVARYLGPGDKGLLSTLMVITGIAVQVSNPALHSANAHLTAKDRSRRRPLLANSFWWSVGVGASASMTVLFIYLIMPEWFAGLDAPLLFIALLSVPAGLMFTLLCNIAIGLEKYLYFNLVELLSALFVMIATILLLVVYHRGLISLVVINTIGAGVCALLMLVYFIRQDGLSLRPSWPLLGESLGYGVFLWLSCLLSFLVLRFDMLVVNYYCGGEGAGWYSVAVMAVDILLIIPAVIGTTLFPRISAIDNREKDTVFALLNQTFAPLYVGLIALTVLLFPWLVRILYGEAFLPATPAFYALAPGALFLGLEILLAQSLAGRGFVRWFPAIWLLVFFVNFACTLLFVKRFGFIGAAYASSLSYFLVFALVLFYHRRNSPLSMMQLFFPRVAAFRYLALQLRQVATGLSGERKEEMVAQSTPDERPPLS
ncbi:MAG TPA: oligosaccharide flippase family protein [bacterium]|nr:oligosaccharide flippase family protein [bacterium]